MCYHNWNLKILFLAFSQRGWGWGVNVLKGQAQSSSYCQWDPWSKQSRKNVFLRDKRCTEWICAISTTTTGIWKLCSWHFHKESEDSSTTLCSKGKHRAAGVTNGSPEASNLENKCFCETKDVNNDSVQLALPQLEFENFVPGNFPKRVKIPRQPCAQRASTE